MRSLVPRLLAAVVLLACGDSVSSTPTEVAAIAIDPDTYNLAPGASTRLEAVVRDAAGNVLTGRDVFWATQDRAIATISPEGVLTAVSPGTVQVAASSEGKSALASVVVLARVARVAVSPDRAELTVGEKVTLAASARDANDAPLGGVSVSWSSSDEAVATVTTTGVVTAVAPGTAVISATSDGVTGISTIVVRAAPVARVTVSPSSLDLGVGESAQVTAVARDADGAELEDRVITWSTSNEAVAVVSSTGLVLARARGSAVITASSEGKSATVPVSVHDVAVASVTIVPDRATIGVGGSVQLFAVARDAAGNPLPGRVVEWQSNRPGTASVSSSGLVSGNAPGSATITATSEGKSATAAITVQGVPVARVVVSPSSFELNVTGTRQLTATLYDASGNVLSGRTVTWSSGNTFIATIDQNGLVRAVKRGEVTLTATSEGKSGNAFLKVR